MDGLGVNFKKAVEGQASINRVASPIVTSSAVESAIFCTIDLNFLYVVGWFGFLYSNVTMEPSVIIIIFIILVDFKPGTRLVIKSARLSRIISFTATV
ncbi:uncharacterized protein CTHT_0074240 [Thermochaetoides thermophila DSM 1495]|uniref:Uncharacterized protein n=1 Tax=Chaetomium thermophilum (strain DSM 1495 / CBS 144.50 / IMI 039719) TaxID=759272 RepID=G0SI25_CHATD|nr:hypothetical protein CTHT_0074240 [Thermochaetoides thermophila DSM 1495]EGS17095.1 hypothetical protein CTHT_0074240 [Thermochaetoides thermophila DSM 1495]